MIKHFRLISLLSLAVVLYTPAGFTQDDEPASVPAAETDAEETAPAGQEVEINEDNYRQFMELKGARRQGDMLPETAYKSQAGMQKIEKLPEESQKHLRNQLREIIIDGDQWQPGDEGGDFPYVPSEAAGKNPALRKLEAEAWGELVDGYHEREAEIYANSSHSKAAAATAGASGGDTGSSEGSPDGAAGQAGSSQQSSRQSRSEQTGSTDSYSPNAANDPNARSTDGVSQNALEFLQQNGSQVANTANTGTGSANGSEMRGTEQASAGQQGGEEQNQASGTPSSSTVPDSFNGPEADAMTGASQNALEYLTGGETQTERGTNNETDTGESIFEANPLPELPSLRGTVPENNDQQVNLHNDTSQPASGQAATADPGDQQGTLTIDDLINAQGIGGAAVVTPPAGDTNDDEQPDETPPANDGSGDGDG